MRERVSDYLRTTITVPHDLKRRMQGVSHVNWSAVACQAFEAKLSEFSQRQGAQEMSNTPSWDDAIERLRRLKNLPDTSEHPRDFEQGFQWGRHWAMATATPQELRRLETLREDGPMWELEAHDGKYIMRKIALTVTGTDLGERRERGAVPAVLREFWPIKVGLTQKPRDCFSFARGFCEGAMQFWTDAKDKI
jgi:hypothetical protein